MREIRHPSGAPSNVTVSKRRSGLDNVWLESGFTKHNTAYGEDVAFTAADDLHRAIAKSIVTGAADIRGQEVRYLRSMLYISQTAPGRIMGVDRSTVARWEGLPDEAIPATADRALRLFYAAFHEGQRVTKEVVELLQAEDDAEHGPRKITMAWDGQWSRAA